MQTLFHVNKFRRSVYSLPHEGELLNSSTTLALQSTFRNLQLSDREVNTKDLTRAFGWTSSDFFLQQDVQEMMRVLLDKLEEKMKDTPMDGLIRDLFGGNVRSFIKCVNVPFESKREEEFYDIQLDVKGCKTIYDSFSKYTENELMNGENQYDAGENYGKQDAHKGVIFTKFPPVLTIHLKRFDFDMNMMGFMKIHDHFKFPLVLELDQYLAEDSPPESKKVPNKFLLHSVLVHAGDVGGGHYYAYIRPSSSYDYSQTDKVDRDSQWFKFDDEHVTRAREREAVESCFGRRLPESGGYRGMTSSAYMLVYIRQAEAPEIMKHIGDDEIPAGLQQRLDSELKLRKSYERRKALKSMFESYSYISEKLLRKYQKYTKTQDLIHEDCMGYDDLMIDSKMLRVLLDRAKSQRVPPYMLRLWMADRIPQKTAPAIRVIDDILVGDMLKPHQGEKYFLQILDKAGRRSTAESLESLPALKIREDEWLRKLYKVLKELPVNQVLVDTEDESADELLQKVCRGCGIGSSNLPLKEILLYDKRIYTDLLDEISDLEEDMMRFLKINTFHLESDSCLIFMTIFDPNNSLPWLNAAERRSTDLDDDLSKADESSESESGKDSNDISSSDQKQSDSVIVDPYLPEYIPMKYLGYAMLPNITLNNLPDVAMRLLEHRMHEYDVDLPVQWSDHNNFRIHLSESPTKCIFIDLDGKDEERTLQSILRIVSINFLDLSSQFEL